MIRGKIDSEFLLYLLDRACGPGDRLPSLNDISAATGVSVGKLREQLQVARMLGLVEISPRRGIRVRPYSFLPAVRLSLMTALSLDRNMFHAYGALRSRLETAFWDEATRLLTEQDRQHLLALVQRALTKLGQDRAQIPHPEHRDFHLTIYCRLNNPFVLGLLEAYWDAYEAIELDTYADYAYLQQVWEYHSRIADAVNSGQYALGKRLLIEHMALIDRRGTTHEFPVGAPPQDQAKLAVLQAAG